MSDIADLLHTVDAVGLATLVKAGEVKPAELLEAAIARVDDTNPALNYIAQDCRARAREQALRPLGGGPLAGVPFLVKDLGVDIAGVTSGAGSRALAHVAVANSTFMDRVDAAGLLTFAKTTTPELGLTVTTESSAHGQTRNPWNRERTTGGSSGGAAAAVALGVVPLAQASDGGGSVRVPASCCGLFGLKPSRGLLPVGPWHIDAWNGLSVIGPISRSVRDAAAFLDVFAGPEAGSRVIPARPEGGYSAALGKPVPRLRIALLPMAGFALDRDVADAFDDAARLFAGLGHTVAEARPQIDMRALNAANISNIAACTASDIAAINALRPQPIDTDLLEPLVQNWLRMGQAVTGLELQGALNTLSHAAQAMDVFFESHDILLSPTLAQPPVALGVLHLANPDPESFSAAFGRFCPFASLANMTGTPAITLPLGTSRDGLPIGIMGQGRFGSDSLLLQLAAEIEQAAPWKDRRPLV